MAYWLTAVAKTGIYTAIAVEPQNQCFTAYYVWNSYSIKYNSAYGQVLLDVTKRCNYTGTLTSSNGQIELKFLLKLTVLNKYLGYTFLTS